MVRFPKKFARSPIKRKKKLLSKRPAETTLTDLKPINLKLHRKKQYFKEREKEREKFNLHNQRFTQRETTFVYYNHLFKSKKINRRLDAKRGKFKLHATVARILNILNAYSSTRFQGWTREDPAQSKRLTMEDLRSFLTNHEARSSRTEQLPRVVRDESACTLRNTILAFARSQKRRRRDTASVCQLVHLLNNKTSPRRYNNQR